MNFLAHEPDQERTGGMNNYAVYAGNYFNN